MTELQGPKENIWMDTGCAKKLAEYLSHHWPHEACGVLRGSMAAGGMRIEKMIPIRNVAPDPLHSFSLHPEEWVQQCMRTSDLLGIFHSHPHSKPIPSDEDLSSLPLFGGLLQIYLISSPNSEGAGVITKAYRIDHNAGNYSLRPVELTLA